MAWGMEKLFHKKKTIVKCFSVIKGCCRFWLE